VHVRHDAPAAALEDAPFIYSAAVSLAAGTKNPSEGPDCCHTPANEPAPCRSVNTIGNPLETTIFLSRLIYEGTLDKFPGLKICGAHAGGYLPSYMGRTDAQCRRQSDVCSGKKRPVDDYFKTQLLADCMIFREDGLRHMVAEMGAGQIVYGTDMPFGWPVTPDFILNARFLNDTQKEQILGGNLIKLLKLAPGATA
jgi:aminocarboxymuconate-semialdehyde decarboxylase